MAVLVEATSVLIRVAAVNEKIAGGWNAFIKHLPTERFCSDDELISVILIDPPEVTAFANSLKPLGLDFDWQGEPVDVAFADQKRGLITPCNWVEFTNVNIGIAGTGPSVAICRMVGSQSHELRLPEGWQYSGSLTEAFGAEANPSH
ncbi:hypothetical protein ADINL_2714 [Nitrincola lacisaponensis]|uniref:Uncharacterized protein n=1 Tax=Nitrincola lacisaponensis TaxID=267850 RepID=A0A063XX86_9GAMM|nr:hypothetical protein [Nitrincola lacisaponensis]KDE38813.1 hypothetical protein ADINL_2714 [Nitrincola lacisaponensis]